LTFFGAIFKKIIFITFSGLVKRDKLQRLKKDRRIYLQETRKAITFWPIYNDQIEVIWVSMAELVEHWILNSEKCIKVSSNRALEHPKMTFVGLIYDRINMTRLDF
jgi:hypothetical protein